MKAITIWQPWASLLVTGQKLYETRSWATSYRGPIAIHAAKRPVRRVVDALAAGGADGWEALRRMEGLLERPGALDQLPTGAVIGKALLVRCNLIDDDFMAGLMPTERALGDFTPGRFAWEFQQMTALESPVPARGAQGIWNWGGVV